MLLSNGRASKKEELMTTLKKRKTRMPKRRKSLQNFLNSMRLSSLKSSMKNSQKLSLTIIQQMKSITIGSFLRKKSKPKSPNSGLLEKVVEKFNCRFNFK
jgi:hypothetical protein